jgi:integrase
LNVIKGELAKGKAPDVPEPMKYQEWYRIWMDEDVLKRLSPKVQGNYRYLHERHVLPFWKDTPLGKVDLDGVKKWVADLEGQRVSPHTIQEAFVAMSSCLSYAVFSEKIPKNPFQGKQVKKRILPDLPTPKKPVLLDPSEILALSKAVPDRYRALVLLLGAHGLRPSEALALTMDDISLTEGFLMVNKAVINVQGKMRLKNKTKTNKERRIDLFPFVLDALIEHVGSYVKVEDDHALLFPSLHKGEYIHTDTLRTIIIKPAGIEIGRPGLTTYNLRHSACVNLIRETGDPKIAQEMLGHSNVTMTLNVYNHVSPSSVASASDIMQRAFEKPVSGAQEAV